MRFPWLVPGLSLVALAALAPYPPGQYPPQYPPNTYPGGGYPPNTYPGGNYPPNGYPSRLPIPEIKLPKRGEKDKSKSENDVKITLASVDGSLRKLGEKDLVLQAGPKKLLAFVSSRRRSSAGRTGNRSGIRSFTLAISSPSR